MATELLCATNDININIHETNSRWSILDKYARLWMIFVLVMVDAASLFGAILTASYIRHLPGMIDDPAYDQLFGLLAVIILVLYWRKSLYPAVGIQYVDELGKIVTSTSLAFLIILGVTFILQTTLLYSRIIFIGTWVLSLVLIPAGRYLVRIFLIRFDLWGEPVFVIGEYDKATEIFDHFSRKLHLGFRPVVIVRDYHSMDGSHDSTPHDAEILIRNFAAKYSIKTALVCMDNLNDIDLMVDRFRNIFQRVILIKDKKGKYGLDGIESMDFSEVLGLQIKNNLHNSSAKFVKRFIDIILTIVGFILISPVLIIIAVAIKLDSPGSIFYHQIRLGKNKRPLVLLKFRTMHQDADQILSKALDSNPNYKEEWKRYQKLKNDPRITRIGKFLRKYSLDELPQLWNVFLGEMSLVGPRPIMVDQRDLYGSTFEDYIKVTPGITGLWQVSGRSKTTFARRVELDHEYIQRWSMWLDVFILLKTLKVAFWQPDAY